jgi:hypothetical protein
MPQSKLTDRTELAATPANGDLLHVVDISDTTGSADGTSKKITVQNLLAAASGGGGGAQVLTVRNNTGSTINAATAVYIDGVTGSTPTINIADHSSATSMPAVGVTNAAINTSTDGEITLLGLILNVDTSGYSVGDTLYVGTSGALTATRPTGEANLVQNIGSVVKVSASVGSILIEGAGRSNDVPNLRQGDVFVGNASNVAEQRQLNFLDLGDTPGTFVANNVVQVNSAGTALQFSPGVRDLDDLTDVTISTTPSNGQVLTYDSATSVFRPQTPSGGGGGSNNMMTNFAFFDNTIRNVYAPWTSETESTTVQRYNRYVVPVDCTVTSVTIWFSVALSGGTGGSIQLLENTSGAAITVRDTVTFSSASVGTTTFTFTTSNTFTAGEIMMIRMNNGFTSAFGNIVGTVLFTL